MGIFQEAELTAEGHEDVGEITLPETPIQLCRHFWPN